MRIADEISYDEVSYRSHMSGIRITRYHMRTIEIPYEMVVSLNYNFIMRSHLIF